MTPLEIHNRQLLKETKELREKITLLSNQYAKECQKSDRYKKVIENLREHYGSELPAEVEEILNNIK